MSKVNVLFIDDDRSLQTLAGAMMNSARFQVLGAYSTKEAEIILERERIDVIVCDVMMPQETGLEFHERLKKKGSKTPFLFLSAVGDPRMMQKGLADGANAYLAKPFEIQELQRRILALAKPASNPL